jgi:N-hydroxyarylamine O-acetyltransferase
LPAGDEWQLLCEGEKGTAPLYAFRDQPHQLGEYEGMCVFHQTSPESHFTRSWICSRATPDGRITIANMRLIVAHGKKREETPLHTEAELRRCLRELMGVELPESVSLAKLAGR